MSDLVGRTIDTYTIIEEIGRGGMAVVYRARQTNINRDVAIKVLSSQYIHHASFRERFNREVQLIAKMRHARILPVYDFGQFDQLPYIVMAYMPGGTLEQRLRSRHITPDEALRYTVQIAEGLHYLHEHDVIHRDFKPSNVLLDEGHQNALLADFGIARFRESSLTTLTGDGLIGTPAYIAPEMFERGEITAAVDVYALGLTLFEMLTGQRPYNADTPVKYMYEHLYSPIPDILQLRPDLPKSVQRVIQTSLAKDPTHRYPSVMDLAAAFENAICDPSGAPHPYDLLDMPETPTAPSPTQFATGLFEAPTVDVGLTEFHQTAGLRRTHSRPPRWLMPAGIGAVILALMGIGTFLLTARGGWQTEAQSDAGSAPDTPTEASTRPPTETLTTAPTVAPGAAAALPTSTLQAPILGGGSGLLGLNAAGQAYVIDVSCILAPVSGCNGSPRLLPTYADGISPSFGVWSPDGQQIIFSASQSGQLYQGALDGSETLPLTSFAASDPAWSSSGNWLAFVGSGDIWLMDMACFSSGGADCTRQMTATSEQESSPRWSPDDSMLSVLRRSSTSLHSVVTLQVANGTTSVITPTGADHSAAGWLPGTPYLLTISSVRGGAAQGGLFFDIALNLIGEDAVSLELQTISSGTFGTVCGANSVCPGGGEIAIPPDGRYAALVMAAHANEDMELYLIELTCLRSGETECAGERVQITNNTLDERSLTWSPDGRLLAFVRARSTTIGLGLAEGGRNAGGDVFILDLDAWLASGDERGSITRATSLGFVDFLPPQWQPALP